MYFVNRNKGVVREECLSCYIDNRHTKYYICDMKAMQKGLPYQTLISSVLHRYVTGQLKPIKAE